MQEIERNIFETAGINFNINSTQQLSNVLFDRLRLIPPDRGRKTASGHFSTSADVLVELRGEHPIIAMILEYRELAKLLSTYVDSLPLQLNPVTHRIHTSFNQTGAVTGRLASSDPNLQNIPTRTELGHKVRQGFHCITWATYFFPWIIPKSNYASSPICQKMKPCVQLSVLIKISMLPPQLLYTTYRLGDVSKDQRQHAKAINFGLIYGMSAFGLSRSTELTLADAEEFVKSYFDKIPGSENFS